MHATFGTLPTDDLSPSDRRLVEILLEGKFLSTEKVVEAIREKAADPARLLVFVLLDKYLDPNRLDEALARLMAEYDEFRDMAGRAMRQRRPSEALALYTRAAEMQGRDASTFRARGMAYAQLGQWELAERDLDRAIELDPMEHTAYRTRALVRARHGDANSAIRDLDRAIERAPDVGAYIDRGSLRQAIGDSDGAMQDFDTARQLDPADARANFRLGALLYRLGRFSESVSYLVRVAEEATVEEAASFARQARTTLAQMAREKLVAADAVPASLLSAVLGTGATKSRVRRTVSVGRPARGRRIGRSIVGTAAVLGAALLLTILVSGRQEGPSPPRDSDQATATKEEPAFGGDLQQAVTTAIQAVGCGAVPVSEKDADVFSGIDYDYLVACGAYTREEADLQEALDRAFVARASAEDSTIEMGEGNVR